MEYSTSKVFNKLKRVAKKDLNLTGDLAQFLLNYENDFRNLQIKDIMEQCHVSVASATRLAKMLGYSGFVELKHVLQHEKEKVKKSSFCSDSDLSKKYLSDISLSLKMLYSDINMDTLFNVTKKIIDIKNVIVYSDFGLEAVFKNLVHRLLKLGINTLYTTDQRIINSYLDNKNETIILGFSYKAQTMVDSIRTEYLSNLILITPDLLEDKSNLYAFFALSNLENLNDDLYILEHINLFAIIQLFYEYLKEIDNNKGVIEYGL